MAENDIYNSKRRYENFIQNYIKTKKILKIPEGKRKYYCKNKENFKYYDNFVDSFEVNDLSYIRRNRLFDTINLLFYYIDCDIKKAGVKESNYLIKELRTFISPIRLKNYEKDIKRIGRILFDGDIPEFFSKFKIRVDVSRQKAREDKLTYDEFRNIVNFFNGDKLMQSYLTLSFETLVRPQELFYTKIKDLEINGNYAIIQISEHGKEGVKKLLCIDSFPYLMSMYNEHKFKNNPNALLFLNKYQNQLTPYAINKKIKKALQKLEINKPITCYSLKRFGITYRRLIGDSDVEIQRLAGWKSTRQMKVYDQSNQDDIFRLQLIKKGIIKDDKFSNQLPKTKPCDFCGELIGFAETNCPNCKRIVDKDLIKKELIKQEELFKKLEAFNQFYELHKEDFDNILNKDKQKNL
ncbi:MAG: site-specific integrase [Candidatus Nanoarchaeia archaeon]|nr:site-specific integrase [Candidatus Nanoarchaeia archaeon]MDD5588131.1 site-specific integrase [Candidatus Nanoarchaeia archaeon]